MRNENHCTQPPSNNPSPSSSNSSSKTPRPPANAFRPEYLDRLVEREEATVAGTEAETRGPWKVVQAPPAGGGGEGGGGNRDGKDEERWLVLRAWEKPEEVEPHASAHYREHALLWAAAVEIASRGSNLGVGLTRDEKGLVISEWSPETGLQTRGHIRVWDEDAAAAFRFLDALLRSPEALARVVDAGGSALVELLGQRLAAGD